MTLSAAAVLAHLLDQDPRTFGECDERATTALLVAALNDGAEVATAVFGTAHTGETFEHGKEGEADIVGRVDGKATSLLELKGNGSFNWPQCKVNEFIAAQHPDLFLGRVGDYMTAADLKSLLEDDWKDFEGVSYKKETREREAKLGIYRYSQLTAYRLGAPKSARRVLLAPASKAASVKRAESGNIPDVEIYYVPTGKKPRWHVLSWPEVADALRGKVGIDDAAREASVLVGDILRAVKTKPAS